MADGARTRKELGRGERVVPGVFRLRLPLPWPGVPHCNAWAIAAGDGIVLVDTGMHEPGSLQHLERALDQVSLRLEHVRLLVCTHAHSDHYGQAATIVERTGCELWMHPDIAHMTRSIEDPERAFERRIEVARQSGVPEEPLQAYAEQRRAQNPGIAGIVLPDRELRDGVVVQTDLGEWIAYETPGHAPSHVCLHNAEHRLMLSGDHLLGRISLYYDYGYSPDPAGEFLRSLDVVERLDTRLCLSGHGRPFTDIQAHIDGNRALVAERLGKVEQAIAVEPRTAYDVVPLVYGELNPATAGWWLSETLVYLRHLEVAGRAERVPGEDGDVRERWRAVSPRLPPSVDRDLALRPGFRRIDDDPQPISEIPDDELLEGFGD